MEMLAPEKAACSWSNRWNDEDTRAFEKIALHACVIADGPGKLEKPNIAGPACAGSRLLCVYRLAEDGGYI